MEVQFNLSLEKSDPLITPVYIIGQKKNLTKVEFSALKVKFGGRISEETFKLALSSLHPEPKNVVHLYLNNAVVAALPSLCSRYNCSAQPYVLTKLVKKLDCKMTHYIVVVCEKKDIFPSGCAVARAYSEYNSKTDRVNFEVKIEFLVIGDDNQNALPVMYLPCLTNVTSGIRMAARIVDAPCNEMNVSAFLEEAKIVAKETNSELTIIQGEELKEKGLNGIYYVGKAASCPPALAVLSKVHPNATTTIAWVGKGIVYDCGGLSLKSKTEMPGMKADCGGAAAILGAFSAAVKLGFNQNLHAVLCLAENAIGPKATRNDDIQTFYSGRTVEINNTDAEGRIVLADGVVYASRDLKATVILDMATLTGAQGTSTGKYHGGLLSNSQEWEECSVRAGKACGDLLMPMVYSPELHFSEFASVVADMKNSVADRYNAQASCAGLFILSHLGFDFNGAWIHVDMAELAVSGERATGYGVALLVTMFCEYIDDKLLNSLKKQVAMPGGQSVKDSSRKRLRLN